jgi:hypothetical protein
VGLAHQVSAQPSDPYSAVYVSVEVVGKKSETQLTQECDEYLSSKKERNK